MIVDSTAWTGELREPWLRVRRGDQGEVCWQSLPGFVETYRGGREHQDSAWYFAVRLGFGRLSIGRWRGERQWRLTLYRGHLGLQPLSIRLGVARRAPQQSPTPRNGSTEGPK